MVGARHAYHERGLCSVERVLAQRRHRRIFSVHDHRECDHPRGRERRGQLIFTLSADGLTIGVPVALTAVGAGNALVFGVLANNFGQIQFMHLWVRGGPAGVTVMASMQRTVPFPNASYGTTYRRIGAWPAGIIGGNTGLSHGQQLEVSSFVRRWSFLGPSSGSGHADANFFIFAGQPGGTNQTYSVLMMPPTSRMALAEVQCTNDGSKIGTGITYCSLLDPSLNYSYQRIYGGFIGPLNVDATQSVIVQIVSTNGNTQQVSAYCFGYDEEV